MFYRTGSRTFNRNDAFQEVDIIGVTRNIAKFVIVVRKREDLNRLIKEAFYMQEQENRDQSY